MLKRPRDHGSSAESSPSAARSSSGSQAHGFELSAFPTPPALAELPLELAVQLSLPHTPRVPPTRPALPEYFNGEIQYRGDWLVTGAPVLCLSSRKPRLLTVTTRPLFDLAACSSPRPFCIDHAPCGCDSLEPAYWAQCVAALFCVTSCVM